MNEDEFEEAHRLLCEAQLAVAKAEIYFLDTGNPDFKHIRTLAKTAHSKLKKLLDRLPG